MNFSSLGAGKETGEPIDDERRFGGLARLYGRAGAVRIRNASVMVVGLGGVGSWTVEALARSGVGRLTLVDMDHVSESNINRQLHALTSTLGQAKVFAMAERVRQINPLCDVVAIDTFLDSANCAALLRQDLTAVVDACDQTLAKFEMARHVLAEGASAPHHICVGAAGGKLEAHRVEVGDLALTSHDPLLAQLRSRLRRADPQLRSSERIGISCVFSREAVSAPVSDAAGSGDGTLNCHGYGSSVAVTATFGMVAAGWILKKISDGSKP